MLKHIQILKRQIEKKRKKERINRKQMLTWQARINTQIKYYNGKTEIDSFI